MSDGLDLGSAGQSGANQSNPNHSTGGHFPDLQFGGVALPNGDMLAAAAAYDGGLTEQTTRAALAINALGRVPAFNLDVTVLEPSQVIAIRCRAQLWDVDGTILHNSGEAIHDGLHARLSRALSELIVERTNELDLREILLREGTIFDLESWQPYRDCGNQAELSVCQGMVNIARRQFGVEISKEELSSRSFDILDRERADFFSRIHLAEGVKQVLLASVAAGIDRCPCTASSERFVIPALEHFDVLKYFGDRHVCQAKKKIGDGQYSGESVEKALELMGSPDPRAVVTFGDSMADIGASVERRVGTIILILESQDKEAALTAFLKQLSAYDQVIGDSLTDGYRPQIFIVNSLSQVRVVGRSDDIVQTVVYKPDA